MRDGVGTPAATVAVDHAAGMRRVLDHLADAGSQRPGVLLPPDDTAWGRETAAGYAGWCDERGIRPTLGRAALTPPAYDMTDVSAQLLAEHPELDAIVAVPDGSAVGVVAAAERHGRTVGDDLHVAAYMDHTVYGLLRPAITALDVRPREHGARCVRALRAVIEGGAEGVGDAAGEADAIGDRGLARSGLDMPLPDLIVRGSTSPRSGNLSR